MPEPPGKPSALTAYVFDRGGGLAYCHYAGGTRDYRSGSWSVLAGYLWWRRPRELEGTIRLIVDGLPARVGARLPINVLGSLPD